MHTNYYFLRQLTQALQLRLLGSFTNHLKAAEGVQTPLRFMECYSQDRDEVVLVFAEAKGKVNYYKPFYIKATLRPDFSGLMFPDRVQRARTNSVDLFETVIGSEGSERAIVEVRSFLNERCLAIVLEEGFTLVFKFFGNRPNLLAFYQDQVVDLFNRQLVTDEQLKLTAFDRPIDQSYEAFERVGFDHRPLFPTFGKLVNRWIEEQWQQADLKTPQLKWAIIQDVLQRLEQPQYYLTRFEHKPALSLLPYGHVEQEFTDPIEATNRFYSRYNGLSTFEAEKANLLRLLDKRQKRAEAQLESTLQRMILREDGISHEQMGHILMANLHDIPSAPGARSPERVTLYDFYHDQSVTLKLKPDLSPQKNAENFYRKAKNEKIEEQHLTDLIATREADMERIGQQKQAIASLQTLKELRRYIKQNELLTDGSEKAGTPQAMDSLFKQVVVDSFRILIGRNAKNNDLLTQRYSYKDDLWLHARDVAGSHVIIKYQAGKPFPKHVIERAAELAAWYSKRRTDSLCPVTVTPKKFVRKPKGLAEGQVIVEKEDVVLVVPRGE
ncbi:NFACT RNA binding domain-containing protein [Spirosoma panaciterrae]|uniref:NFACT RNA binding domain-containing protein n=1 Tax=Spirosoma panaciterrae TaxID=496058 RepID=UPI00036E422F|nr:NFACT RNA binding domain-containing protein [Spirosoma panaciterrae]